MEYNILINIIKNSSTINLVVILCVTINRFVFLYNFWQIPPKIQPMNYFRCYIITNYTEVMSQPYYSIHWKGAISHKFPYS